MRNRASEAPWTTRAYELLEKGPLPLEKLYVQIGRLIPPEHALFKRQVKLRWERMRKRYPPGYPRDTTLERKLEIGRRAVARDAISGLARRGYIVLYVKDGQRWARALTPRECEAKQEWWNERRRVASVNAWRTRKKMARVASR